MNEKKIVKFGAKLFPIMYTVILIAEDGIKKLLFSTILKNEIVILFNSNPCENLYFLV